MEPAELASLSRNTPFAGRRLPGRVLATFLRGRVTARDGAVAADCGQVRRMTRLMLVVGCLRAVRAGCCWACGWGWRNRGQRQADLPELPTGAGASSDAELAPALTGLYVGSTRRDPAGRTGSWCTAWGSGPTASPG